MIEKAAIVFSGFNQRAVLGFIRVLESNDFPYAIVALSNADPFFLTSYSRKILSIRESRSLELTDIMRCLNEVRSKLKAREYIIAPSSEALNRFLLDNQSLLNSHEYQIPLVNKELYELVSDKNSFSALCQSKGITTPAELSPDKRYSYPFVAKPRKYFAALTNEALSPVIIYNQSDLESFKQRYQMSDFYFQEYITGSSYYLLYYFHRNGKIYKFSQQNLIQQPGGKSIVAAVSSTIHKTAESEKYEGLFTSLNFYGLVMVEIKRMAGRNYMIEANPRFWGPSQLFIDANMNFFEAFLHDFYGLKKQPTFKESQKKVKYFWFGGIIEAYKQKRDLVYHNYIKDGCDLAQRLPRWLDADIYRRKDTWEIFNNELL